METTEGWAMDSSLLRSTPGLSVQDLTGIGYNCSCMSVGKDLDECESAEEIGSSLRIPKVKEAPSCYGCCIVVMQLLDGYS